MLSIVLVPGADVSPPALLLDDALHTAEKSVRFTGSEAFSATQFLKMMLDPPPLKPVLKVLSPAFVSRSVTLNTLPVWPPKAIPMPRPTPLGAISWRTLL